MVAGQPAVWERKRPPEHKKEMEKQNGCSRASKGIHGPIHRSTIGNSGEKGGKWLLLTLSVSVCQSDCLFNSNGHLAAISRHH